MKHNATLTFLFFLWFSQAFAVTRFVTPDGAGSKNGTSWSNAYPGTSLQLAINQSASGDEVWVAAGTYKTSTGTDRTISFSMKNGVKVYGSFEGTESTVNQRLFLGYQTGLTSILSAEIGAAGVDDNSYHVISNKNLNSSAYIDGFIIRDGCDSRPATTENQGLGGGMFNEGNYGGNACSPSVVNCVFINNKATFGGGMFNSGMLGGTSSPTISNCVFTENTATEGGGAMDNFGLGGTTNPTLTNCVIYKNNALLRGGAMYCWGGNNGSASPVLNHCTIVNNTAPEGGGIICDRQNSAGGNSGAATPAITNCIFRGNTASTGIGPHFFLLGGATFSATYTSIDLSGQTGTHVISGTTTGNINTDPKFVAIADGDGTDNKWITLDDGLYLTATSPCVNSGLNGALLYDIFGRTRKSGVQVDMGAYEYNSGVGIEENSFTNTSIIYPNPATSSITISNYKGENIIISSITGSIVYNSTTDLNGTVDISELPNGIYILKMGNASAVKLVKAAK